MTETAVVLANGLLRTPFAKTTHGLVRGPSRYRLLAVIDPDCRGEDAGEVLDGRHRGIPVFDCIADMTAALGSTPDACIVGVATVGGVLPPSVRRALLEAADTGMTLVNGLHQLLSEDAALARVVARRGGRIIDIRKPKAVSELRFWSGQILSLPTSCVAVLGTDCAIGKRTTAAMLWQAFLARGIKAELIYTGQTGWLQGLRHGFILDATPNDFVCGELEGAILDCYRETDPDLILLEGQSGLRNPAGPCGSELILATGAKGVVLQHAPGRRYFEDLEELGCEIPPLRDELDIIRLMGSEVWALTLNDERLDDDAARAAQEQLAEEFGLPVAYPLRDGVESIVSEIGRRLELKETTA